MVTFCAHYRDYYQYLPDIESFGLDVGPFHNLDDPWYVKFCTDNDDNWIN